MRHVAFASLWAVVALALPWQASWAQNFADVATISATMGVQPNRVCVGETTRGDIGCPTYAPRVGPEGGVSLTSNLDVSGTVRATQFVGDGSGLTGVIAAGSDRITSGTTSLVVVSGTGFVSLTQGGTNTGWFDPTRGLVTLGVSATGGISGTTGYFAGNVGIGTAATATPRGLTISTTNQALFAGSSNSGLVIQSWNNYADIIGINAANNSFNGILFRTGIIPALYISPTNSIGIGTTSPNVSLTVVGEVQVSNSGVLCSGTTSGAIRYTAGSLQFCNNANTWVTLGSAGMADWYGLTNIPTNVQNVSNGTTLTMQTLSATAVNGLYISGTNGFFPNLGAGAIGANTISSGLVSATNISGTFAQLRNISTTNISATGNIQANRFIGDGSGLTGVIAAGSDRITSGTTSFVVVSGTGFVSLTQGGTNTGWFDPTRGLVTLGVSATGGISGTTGYFAGNVGIGTSSPGAPLHVRAGADRNFVVGLSVDVSAGVALSVTNDAGSANMPLELRGAGLVLGAFSNQAIRLQTQSVERMRITENGWVGIGTQTPLAQLHLSGNGSQTTAIVPAANGVSVLSAGANQLSWPAGWGGGLVTWDMMGASALFSGFVGIGLPEGVAPSSSLHVGGVVMVEDPVSATGGYAYIRMDSRAALASKSLNIVYGGYGSYDNVLQFDRAGNNFGGWEASPVVFDMDAPSYSLWMAGNGNVGMGTWAPITRLDVSGSLRIADGGEACASSTVGAIRYSGGGLSFCNGAAWTTLASSSGTVPGGVSGSIQFNGGGGFAGRSDLVMRSDGAVQLGITYPYSAPQGAPGRQSLSIGGSSDAGVLDLVAGGGDLSLTTAGIVQFTQPVYGTDFNKARVAAIGGRVSGSLAGDRGGFLDFYTKSDGGILSERMRITENGWVGIGTQTPLARLQVTHDRTGGNVAPFMVMDSTFGTGTSIFGAYPGIGFNYSYNGSTPLAIKANNFAGEVHLNPTVGTMNFLIYDKQATDMASTTLLSAPLTLVSTGNVGIGTSSPGAKLDVAGMVSATTGYFREKLSIGTSSGTWNLVISDSLAPVIEIREGDSGGSTFIGQDADLFFIRRGGIDSVNNLTITSAGLAINAYSTPASLTIVAGEIQTGSSGMPCSGVLSGAIRYSGGGLSFCNGAAWTTLAAGGSVINDRIVGSNANVVAGGGMVSISTGGVSGTAYFDTAGRLVAPGVSATGGISATTGYFGESVGIGTLGVVPSATLHVSGTLVTTRSAAVSDCNDATDDGKLRRNSVTGRYQYCRWTP